MKRSAAITLLVLSALATGAAAEGVRQGAGAYRRVMPLSSAQSPSASNLLYGQPQGDKALSSYKPGGSSSYGANTATFQDIGPLTYGSDGTMSQTIGGMTYVVGPDGHTVVCQKIANQSYCN